MLEHAAAPVVLAEVCFSIWFKGKFQPQSKAGQEHVVVKVFVYPLLILLKHLILTFMWSIWG